MSKEKMTPQPTERHELVFEQASDEAESQYQNAVTSCGLSHHEARELAIETGAAVFAENFPDWMPIEDYVKDESCRSILLTDMVRVGCGFWHCHTEEWSIRGPHFKPTHFREIGPLPKPQTSKEAE